MWSVARGTWLLVPSPRAYARGSSNPGQVSCSEMESILSLEGVAN